MICRSCARQFSAQRPVSRFASQQSRSYSSLLSSFNGLRLSRRPSASSIAPSRPTQHSLAESSSSTSIIASVSPCPSNTRAFSASAALLGPRPTYVKITHRVRKRRFGFLARVKCRTGRAILKRRQNKGRQNMSH